MRTMPKAVDAVNKMAACRAALPRIVNLTVERGLHGITAVHPAIFNTLIKINTKCDNEPPAHGGDLEPVQLPSRHPSSPVTLVLLL